MERIEPHVLVHLSSRIRAGDPGAENALTVLFSAPVLEILRRATRDRAAADDLHQEVLLAVILRLRRSELSDPAALFGFIRRVAKHKLADHRARRSADRARTAPLDETAPSGAASSLDLLLAAEDEALLARAIAMLPAARDRELMHRLLVLQEPREEVQRDLGLTDAAFHRVMHRVRARVRRGLEKLRRG